MHLTASQTIIKINTHVYDQWRR